MKRLLRLLRRTFTWLCRGLCLLSLLACLGTVWLWWRGKHAEFGMSLVEVTGLHADLMVMSGDPGLGVRAIGRWPEGAGARAGDVIDASVLPDSFPSDVPGLKQRTASIGRVFMIRGELCVYMRSDGTPYRLSLREWITTSVDRSPSLPRSRPLPYWQASGIPHWLAVAFFALSPLLWLAGFSRRFYINRRRRRLGLCRRCGYDLTGNTSGRCSECGEAVEAVPAERTPT